MVVEHLSPRDLGGQQGLINMSHSHYKVHNGLHLSFTRELAWSDTVGGRIVTICPYYITAAKQQDIPVVTKASLWIHL